MNTNTIYTGDCRQGLKTLHENSVDCCITSPPYFGLRDYGEDAQIGLEPSPEEYIAKLVEVFTEVHRVLKPTGTLWVKIGYPVLGITEIIPKKKKSRNLVEPQYVSLFESLQFRDNKTSILTPNTSKSVTSE